MPTQNSIRDAIISKIALIHPDNGYATTLSADLIFNGHHNIESMRQDNALLPKTFVIYQGTMFQQLPGNRIVRNDNYLITVVFLANRDNPNDKPLVEQVNEALEDFEKLINLNNNVGGADSFVLEAASTDAGYANPEAVLTLETVVSYRKTY